MPNDLKTVLNALVYLKNKAEVRAEALPPGEGKDSMALMNAELGALVETVKVLLLRRPGESDDIKAIRARLEAAAPGPWTGDRIDGTVKYAILDANGDTVVRGCNGNHDPSYGIVSDHDPSYGIVSDHDATEALILHAPTDLAALCDEVERLRALLRWREGEVPRG